MSQIFSFDTGAYDAYVNGDGPANEAQREERASGTLTKFGKHGVVTGTTQIAKVNPGLVDFVVVQSVINIYQQLINEANRAKIGLQKRVSQLLFSTAAKVLQTLNLYQTAQISLRTLNDRVNLLISNLPFVG